jgi:hypothetical protein
MPACEPAAGDIVQLEYPPTAVETREEEPDSAKVRPVRHKLDVLHRRAPPIAIRPAVADRHLLALALQGGGRAINPLQSHARPRRWHLLNPKLPQIFGDRAFPFRWYEHASARCPS